MYVKIFSSIVTSSITSEAMETRLTWFMLLAMKDADGFVRGSEDGISRVANIPMATFQAALAVLAAPDARRPGQAHEGRRIERTPEGIVVLNHARYRDHVDADTVRDQTRERMRRSRERRLASPATPSASPLVTVGDAPLRSVTFGDGRLRYTDTDTDTDTTQHGARFADADQRLAYLALRGAATSPRGFDAALAGVVQPVGGGAAYPWAVVGRALVEMQATGAKGSPAAIRAYCRRLLADDVPPPATGRVCPPRDAGGSPSTKQTRARDGLRTFLCTHEAPDAECASGGEIFGPVQRALPDARGQPSDSGGVDDRAA